METLFRDTLCLEADGLLLGRCAIPARHVMSLYIRILQHARIHIRPPQGRLHLHIGRSFLSTFCSWIFTALSKRWTYALEWLSSIVRV